MSYLLEKLDCKIVRKTKTLQKFLDEKKVGYFEDEQDVSNCGVEENQGVVEYKGVLYGELIFCELYPFTNQGVEC